MRFLAAYARGEHGRDLSTTAIPLWFRFAIPASAAAAVVLAVGLGGAQRSSGSGGSMIAMVAHGSVPAPAAVAMRVVDDPSIPMASGSSGSAGMPLALGSWSADGLDGP